MKKIASTLLLALALSRFASAQPLAFSKFFASNMVLQRDTQVPVWGWANPGEQVTVTFAGQSKTAVADGTGRWEIKLDSMAANAAGTNLVATGSSTTLHYQCSRRGRLARLRPVQHGRFFADFHRGHRRTGCH